MTAEPVLDMALQLKSSQKFGSTRWLVSILDQEAGAIEVGSISVIGDTAYDKRGRKIGDFPDCLEASIAILRSYRPRTERVAIARRDQLITLARETALLHAHSQKKTQKKP